DRQGHLRVAFVRTVADAGEAAELGGAVVEVEVHALIEVRLAGVRVHEVVVQIGRHDFLLFVVPLSITSAPLRRTRVPIHHWASAADAWGSSAVRPGRPGVMAPVSSRTATRTSSTVRIVVAPITPPVSGSPLPIIAFCTTLLMISTTTRSNGDIW